MRVDTLQEQIGQWGVETFGATSTGTHKKFKHEVEEFNEAFDTLHEVNRHKYFLDFQQVEGAYKSLEDEAVDVLFMLFQTAYFCDFDLIEKAREKFEINKARSWVQNPDGTFQHVEDAEDV